VGGCREGSGSGSPTGFPPELNGELGRGDFRYRCLDESDAYCEADTFPAAIALGARFDLDYEPGTPLSLSGLSVESGSAFAEELGDVYEVRDAGRFVMLAVHQGEVVDLVHVLSQPMVDIAIEDAAGFVLPELRLGLGETMELEALPLDPSGRLLAGSLQYQWRVEAPEAASLRAPGLDPRRIVVTGEASGDTMLTVAVGEVEQTIPLRVDDESPRLPPDDPDPPPDTDGSDTDAGSTGGTGGL
jgi:hypothetical protein